MTCSTIKNKFTYFHLHAKVKTPEKSQFWYNQENMIKHFDKNIYLYCIPEKYKDKVRD
jgi:hypothetical protein